MEPGQDPWSGVIFWEYLVTQPVFMSPFTALQAGFPTANSWFWMGLSGIAVILTASSLGGHLGLLLDLAQLDIAYIGEV